MYNICITLSALFGTKKESLSFFSYVLRGACPLSVSIAGFVINLSCDGQREDTKQLRS